MQNTPERLGNESPEEEWFQVVQSKQNISALFRWLPTEPDITQVRERMSFLKVLQIEIRIRDLGDSQNEISLSLSLSFSGLLWFL